MPTILFVDDDANILRINGVYFRSRDYTVLTAGDFAEAQNLLLHEIVDCVVLDILLPGTDGWEICRQLQENGGPPVIFLTCLDEKACMYHGFELGAFDYVTKPYELRELELRIQAKLRQDTDRTKEILSFPPLTIEPQGRLAKVDGKTLMLTAFEFDILLLLAKNPDKIFSLEEIYRQVWKQPDLGRTETTRNRVAQMRHKLEAACPDRVFIDRVWGKGFVFRHTI